MESMFEDAIYFMDKYDSSDLLPTIETVLLKRQMKIKKKKRK